MRSPIRPYSVALAAVAAATVLRLLLDPVLHNRVPFLTFEAAVVFAAWYAGPGPAVAALLAGALAVAWFVLEPRGGLAIAVPEHRVGLLLYAVVGAAAIGMMNALRRTREQLRVTLASIGDGVITTDREGRVQFLNPVAEELTGWTTAEATGLPLTSVFRIVNEETRQTVEDPAARALREGRIVGLANHTLLIAKDGTERPIDDSAAPIRDPSGRVAGCVLVFHDVTEVRHGERRYRLLVEQSADGIFVAEPDGRYVDVNRAGCEMFGMTRAEMLTKRIHDLIVPEQAALLPDCLEWRRDGEVKRSEFRYRRKDGSTFEGEVFSRFLPDGRLQGVLRDITERKRAEATLRASAATMEQLVSNSPFGVYVVDQDFRIVVMGQVARRAFDTVNPLIGRDLAEALRILWPEPFATEAIERFRHTLATGEPYQSPDTVEQRADRNAVEAYDWRIDRVTLPDGRFGVVCWFYDLTERQLWERRLAAATEVAEVGIHQWNVLTGEIYWDQRVRTWWGVSADEPVTYETFLGGVHPEDRDLVTAAIQAVQDPAGSRFFRAEYRVAAPGQPIRWVRATGRMEFVDDTPVSLVGGVVDITGPREQEAALREQDRRKDQFLATLSHELRNPLAPIRSAADLLAHDGLAPEQVATAQRIIRRQASHMARLLDDLLDVARVTQGKMVLRRETVPLATLVDAALETARPLIEARRHALHVELPAAPLSLHVDPHRMAQVLANLLSNAARYTDAGGRIDLRAGCDGDQLELCVRDTGIGIPPEALGSIFDMFAQGSSDGHHHDGGLGIGLALVRGIVELHGGTVMATSPGPGRGAEFTVRLPGSVVVATEVVTDGAGGDGRDASRLRVLVADDNRDAADSLAALLRLAGHAVRVVYDGRTALEVAETFRPDVLLLDLGMPDVTGQEVAAAVRRRPWARRAGLVAVTGWGQESDRTGARASGFDEHLVKPVEFAELRAILTRMAPTA